MIYTFIVKAKEVHTVRTTMKMHAKTEDEARELCMNLLRNGNARVYWTDDGISGDVKDPYISSCTETETDFDYQMRTGISLDEHYK